MAVPGEGYVDKGKLHYFGGKPFVENGEFSFEDRPCSHGILLGKNSKGKDIWRIPLSYVVFIGHPEEYKSQGYCVHCAVGYVMKFQGETEGIP